MEIKAIIFDMDGTVIDTEHIWNQATVDLLAERNVVLTPHEHDHIITHSRGIGLLPGCTFLKERFQLEDQLHMLANELNHRAHHHFKTGLRFINGFINFHQSIIENQLKNGLATNADDATLELANQALNLMQFFGNHMYNISHVNNRAKPDPAVYLHAADQLKVKPEHCIAIEDSAHGIAAARSAGIFCIGINTARDAKALKDANLIIEGYAELDLVKLSKTH